MTHYRRKFLRLCGLTGIGALAGCSGINTDESTQKSRSTSNLGGANFDFEYVQDQDQVIIQYNGGAEIVAGDLQVRSSNGLQIQWSQLGSTVAGSNDRISPDATAVLGENVLNWEEPVSGDETIRLVHTGRDAPATLGRFTPPEQSTLTSTVPQVDTPTPTEEPTATPTPELDTTAPSISAFSISNPSGQNLRTSFESDEQLADIEVTITGAASTVLTESAFSETTNGGIYSYEATYGANSDGDYTAGLTEAADMSGNDGANAESVTLSVDTTTSTTLALRHKLNGDFSDSVNNITGEPASDGYAFVEDRGGTVLELSGSGMSTSGGYYSIPQDELADYLATGGPFTIAQWVKPENNEGWEMIHSAPSASINIRYGNIRLNDFADGTNQFVAEADADEYVPNNEWSHVVGTVEPGEAAELYVDGELVASDSAGEDRGFSTSDTLTQAVGYHGDDNDGSFDAHFTGRIDDVRFYSGAMQPDQIKTLYQNTSETIQTDESDAPQTISESFEDGVPDAFVQHSDHLSIVDSGYNGGQALHGSNYCGTPCHEDPMATYTPSLLEDGVQLTRLEFYWQETSGSFGAAISLHDGSGTTAAGAATDNPEWVVVDPTVSGDEKWEQMHEGEGYDRWVRTEIVLDWDARTVEYRFNDQQSGTTATETVDMHTDVETITEVQFRSYTTGNGIEGITNGSIEHWWDEFTLEV